MTNQKSLNRRCSVNQRTKSPENKSQKLMKSAYEEIQNQLSHISDKKGFLKSVERLELMEFIEASEGDAIRIFQTVNDRGKPLSNMEKAKSLLIYFSNRYLEKRLDGWINKQFGEMFDLYDDIKQLGEDNEINLIKRIEFSEDDIMRYHFITFSDENYDPTAAFVLDFLKRKLSSYRNHDTEKQNGYQKMERFITRYVEELSGFFRAFRSVIAKVQTDHKYYKIFSVLGISATLYPVIITLQMLGLLDKKLPNNTRYTFRDLLEIIDVRIYKTRGTDPRAEISRFAHEISAAKKSDKYIQDWLLDYNQGWMSKDQFLVALNDTFYGNRGLPHMFLDYCEHLGDDQLSVQALKQIVHKIPTIEHIVSVTPNFRFRAAGYKNEKEFVQFNNTIGNLTILEKALNSAVQNKHPLDKVNYYDRSLFKMTKEIATSIQTKKRFVKDDVIKRTKELSQYFENRWWC